MGGRKKKKKNERTKNPKERGAGGVGSFRICNDCVPLVGLWHRADCWANSGETRGVCVGIASSLCHLVRNCKVSTNRGH